MSSQVLVKANSYLTGGKIQVVKHNAELAILTAQGSEQYVIAFGPAGWNCTCPARLECAHIVAAKLISPLRMSEHIGLAAGDDELTAYINSFPRIEPENIYEESPIY